MKSLGVVFVFELSRFGWFLKDSLQKVLPYLDSDAMKDQILSASCLIRCWDSALLDSSSLR